MGSGQWAAGSGRQAVGGRQWAGGSGRQAVGKAAGEAGQYVSSCGDSLEGPGELRCFSRLRLQERGMTEAWRFGGKTAGQAVAVFQLLKIPGFYRNLRRRTAEPRRIPVVCASGGHSDIDGRA